MYNFDYFSSSQADLCLQFPHISRSKQMINDPCGLFQDACVDSSTLSSILTIPGNVTFSRNVTLTLVIAFDDNISGILFVSILVYLSI